MPAGAASSGANAVGFVPEPLPWPVVAEASPLGGLGWRGGVQAVLAMAEQAAREPGRAGADDAPLAGAGPMLGPGRRSGWRRRWPLTRPGRPPWWEVPPSGYLEVESRHSPTRPRALRTLARAAVRAGLAWSPGRPLPVQGFVAAQERARLVFHARRELPRVTAVASQVMVVDARLAEAEELLDRAGRHRSSLAAAGRHRAVEGSTAPATDGQAVHDAPGRLPASATGALVGTASRRRVLGPWSAAAVLAVVAGGQGLLASVVARDLGLGPVALGLFSLVAAVGVVAAARLAAHGIDRLGSTPEGSQPEGRRRWLEVAVAGAALTCGITLAVAIGHLRTGTGPAAVGLALLGLATAVSYAAIPDGPGATATDRWPAVAARLRQQRQDRRGRRRLRATLAREVAAQATVRQLREELAVLVPQLFAAEQAALLFWRYQVAVGDATQHAFEQHLAAFTVRRSRGVWRPVKDWWRGATPAVADAAGQPTSVGAAQPDWTDQVTRVTTAAKRVLVRRRLLDVTHGLRLPSLSGGPPARRNGSPAGRNPGRVAGDGDRPPLEPDAPNQGEPGER